MNYHVIFCNPYGLSFVDDVIALEQEQNNVFWFRGSKSAELSLPASVKYDYLGEGYAYFQEKLNGIQAEDHIFIHYYDIHTARYLKNVPNKIFAFMWGGDFFQDPYWYHMNWVFGPKTKQYVLKHEREKFIFRKNIAAMYRQFKKLYREPKLLYKEKNNQMALVDYVLCNEHNKADVQKARELYPKLKAKHLGASYNLRFDQVLRVVEENYKKKKRLSDVKLKVMLGNSATTANNHLDAFEILRKREDIEIHCVLSYGNMEYGKFIQDEGNDLFGQDFIPMLEMKTPEEYIKYLNEMDVIVMDHHRSQAWGNISQCIAMGKPVFMNSQNALKNYIEEIGLKVYDIEDFDKLDMDKIITQEENKIALNRKILKEISSDETRLNCLRKIFEEYAV